MSTAASSQVIIRKASLNDIPTIQQITYVTWPVAYKNILSKEQLQYMLQLIYSTNALTQQFNKGDLFYIAELHNKPVGFASFGFYEKPDVYKLHKLYVLPETQGTGTGKALLQMVLNEIKLFNAASLTLNVNRRNKAIEFYKKSGFSIIKEEDIDIGNGYFMNDYVMEKKLAQ